MSTKKYGIVRGIALFLTVILCLGDQGMLVCAKNDPKVQKEQETPSETGERTKTEEPENREGEERRIEDYQVVSINSAEDYMELVKDCRFGMDTTKTYVKINRDLNLEGSGTEGVIPSFSGWFDGNGYTISGIKLVEGSGALGLFGYIEEGALVEKLKVEIEIVLDDANNYVGGITGVNAGTISNCEVSGRMLTVGVLGGIAGINGATGKIENCTGGASISSLSLVGGVAGRNRGEINGCTNLGNVNAESDWLYFEDDSTYSLTKEGIVDRLASYAKKGSDIGGVAGYSDGKISNSRNMGVVGYAHSGKNVGGIAGRMSGQIIGCKNEGKVFGKMDVGGIAGQFEPTLIGDGQNAVGDAVENLEHLSDRLSDDVTKAGNTLSEETANVWDSISEIQTESQSEEREFPSVESGPWDSEAIDPEIEKVKSGLSSVKDKLGSADKSFDDLKKDAKDTNDTISTEVEEGKRKVDQYGFDPDTYQTIRDQLTSTGERIEQSYNNVHATTTAITKDINDINNQVSALKNIAKDKRDNLKRLKDGEPLIEDYSAVIPDEEKASRISDCTNSGNINGDRNVGGITGSIAIEGMDTEDESLEEYNDTYMTLAVLEESVNSGILVVKKENGGGIAGYGDLGFIRSCKDNGRIMGKDANYLGGITGSFKGTIHSCVALSVIDGNDYIGGIAGVARRVNCCYAMAQIISGGGWLGSVIGDIYTDQNEDDITLLHREMKDSVFDNYYVEGALRGIDGADYKGVVTAISYEELLKLPQIDSDFKNLFICFCDEDMNVIGTRSVKYGESLMNIDFPKVDIDSSEYASWEGFYSDTVLGNVYLVYSTVENIRTLASESVTDTGKPRAFLSGVFSEVSKFDFQDITESYTPTADSKVTSHMYHASVRNTRAESDKEYKLRIFDERPDEETYVYILEDSEWKQIETKIVGSYIEVVFGGEEATVCIQQSGKHRTMEWYYIAGLAILPVILLMIFVGKKL